MIDALLDGVLPPDLSPRSDGSKPAIIGEPCDPESERGCAGETICQAVGLEVGLCTRPDCTLEDLTTPAKEDDCPPDAACALAEIVEEGKETVTRTFCLPTCTPSPTENPCATIHPRLACDPLSLVVTGHVEVCLVPACTANTDCGNRDPIKPDARCDLTTGICFNHGDQTKAVGDPCTSGRNCGPGQLCLTELRTDNTVRFKDGYCTVVGCKYQGPWSCPESSACIGMGSDQALTMCLATGCDPAKPPESDGCRDEAPPGQYDCVDVDSEGVCWLDITP